MKGKGPAAKEVAEVIERLRREAVADAATAAAAWSDSDSDEDKDDPHYINFGGLRVGRGLHFFTLELNLSNSRTHS